MSGYPAFSGDEPECVKCGHKGALTKYREYGQCIHGNSLDEIFGWEPNDRLHRECDRCGYQWDEATVGADSVLITEWPS